MAQPGLALDNRAASRATSLYDSLHETGTTVKFNVHWAWPVSEGEQEDLRDAKDFLEELHAFP